MSPYFSLFGELGTPGALIFVRRLNYIYKLSLLNSVQLNVDTMAEWLRRVIRNHLGLSRTGSSPVSVEIAFATNIFLFIFF